MPVSSDDGGDVPLEDLPSGSGRAQQVPHIEIDMQDEGSDREQAGYRVSDSYRHSGDSDAVHMDEEELRQANQDVMQMQQQMIDRKLAFVATAGEETDLAWPTDQDGQLEQLSKAIARQRDLSLTISSELEIHEGLLEETDQALTK